MPKHFWTLGRGSNARYPKNEKVKCYKPIVKRMALLSGRRFVTRMISLRVFLHFCVGHRHTNQELSSGKSSLERILKKSKKTYEF